MAWLNGHQSHFTMVGGQQSARSLVHLAEVFRLADAGGPAARSGARRQRACARCSPCTASKADDERCPTIPTCCRSTRRRVRAQWKLPTSSPAARATASAASRRGATRSPRRASSDTRAAHPRRGARRHRAIAAAACFRPSTARAAAPRSTTTAAPSTKRCALGARCLVLVVGGLPKDRDGAIASKDLAGAREMVRDGIGELLDYARAAGMPLAIEPLHPMYAADRACVNTIAHANDLCDELAPRRRRRARHRGRRLSRVVGPATEARDRARRRAPSRLFAYHICDWLVPTTDLLNDRGMMGDGVIDLPLIRVVDGGRRLPRHARSGDLLAGQLVEARSRTTCWRPAGAATPSAAESARRGRRADVPGGRRADVSHHSGRARSPKTSGKKIAAPGCHRVPHRRDSRRQEDSWTPGRKKSPGRQTRA